MAIATNSYIYLHLRQDTNTPFYVGKGTKYRFSTKKDRNTYWHNIVNKVGFKPIILQSNLTHQQALNAEKLTIALFKKFFKLVNLTDGGDGGNGLKAEKHPLYGKPRSEEVKRKLSNALKGRSFLHCHSRLGTKMSEEQKAKISSALKGRKKTLQHIKNASEGFKIAMALKQNGRVKS